MKSTIKPTTKKDFAPFTNSGIFYKEGDDRAIMYQAAHYELVASARAVKIGHEINPDFQIGMIAMCPIYPATAILRMSSHGYESQCKSVIIFADVHVFGLYPEHILKYWERKGIRLIYRAGSGRFAGWNG